MSATPKPLPADIEDGIQLLVYEAEALGQFQEDEIGIHEQTVAENEARTALTAILSGYIEKAAKWDAQAVSSPMTESPSVSSESGESEQTSVAAEPESEFEELWRKEMSEPVAGEPESGFDRALRELFVACGGDVCEFFHHAEPLKRLYREAVARAEKAEGR